MQAIVDNFYKFLNWMEFTPMNTVFFSKISAQKINNFRFTCPEAIVAKVLAHAE